MNLFARLKIREKLILGFSVLVLLTLATGIFGYAQINKIIASDTRLYEKGVIALEKIGAISSNFQRVRTNVREIILETTPQEIAVREKRIWMFRENVGTATEVLEKALPDAEAKKLFDTFMEARKDYGLHLQKTIALAKQNKDADAITYLSETAYTTESAMIASINELSEYLARSAKHLSDQNSATAMASGKFMQGLVLCSTLIALIMAALITRSIANPLQLVLKAVIAQQERGKEKARLVEAIAGGDLNQVVVIAEPLPFEGTLVHRDETGLLLQAVSGMNDVQRSLDLAFAAMTESLRRNKEQEVKRNWFKNGINELNTILRGEKNTAELTEQVLAFLSEYLGAKVGAFYTYHEQEETLHIAASYAYSCSERMNRPIALGEGVTGQAALEKSMICLRPAPPEYLTISSGLGAAEPINIVVLPLTYNGLLVGVLELGSFNVFTDDDLEFLQQSKEGVAIALSVNKARQLVNELLEQTQSQAEELRVQQEELQQTNEELEERAQMLEQQREQIRAKNREVEEASRELQYKADELERISTYKSEFLANMSHELRTPLNSLMILSSLLRDNRDGNLTAKQVEFAATINGAGRDLLNLINDILDLSKIESGHLEYHYEELSLRDICTQLETTFNPIAGEKGINFTTTVDGSAPVYITADSQRTQQILKNLLSNACKFTSSGSVTLRAYTPESGGNPLTTGAVAFSVTDSGIGIAADKLALIFSAFQQADGSTSRTYGGTGLGLSISRQLARSMGGEITVESEPDKGSTFTLFLPSNASCDLKAGASHIFEAAQPPVVPAEQQPLSSAAGTNARNLQPLPMPLPDDREQLTEGSKSILIIEDDLTFAGILIRLVRERRFAALVAADGENGIAMAERYLPSAIILDVMLPHIDGWGVMRSLKDSPLTRHIPVHFITCLEDRLKAMSMGAIGFVTKPVNSQQMDSVFSVLESAIEKTMKKLLIVEDDPVQAKAMVALLEDRNITITVAENGTTALKLLVSEQFDCIVLDLGLADMGAFDLLEELKKHDPERHIPVIIHTGRDLSQEDERRLHHYAESIIIKGTKSPERLLNEVTLFLHLVETSLDLDKQRMIRASLDKEAMLAGKRILIVDDDMRNIFSLSSALSEKDLIILEAENGYEALKQLDENPNIDLVLMDIMMPEMDGYEAMRQIRNDPRFHDLPIIALTAKAMKGDREECIKAGASDYIPKPVNMDKLFSLLRVWLYSSATPDAEI